MTRGCKQRSVLLAGMIRLALLTALAMMLCAAPDPRILDSSDLLNVAYSKAWAKRNGGRDRGDRGKGRGHRHGNHDHDNDSGNGSGGDDDSGGEDTGDDGDRDGDDASGDTSGGKSSGGKSSGDKGKSGKGRHGGSDDSDSDSDSDSDTGAEPGNPDGKGKSDTKGSKDKGKPGNDQDDGAADQSDSDSDSGDQPGNSDGKGKGGAKGNKDKSKTNNSQSSSEDDGTTSQPEKGKSVAAKGKNNKKDKKPATEADETRAATTHGASGPEHSADHKSGQVVGVGMSSDDVAAVSALGFSVATTAITTTEVPVVEIMVPTNIDEEDARAALARALPGRRFGLNKLYGGYSTATSKKSSSATTSIDGSPGADPRCVGDQCYGRVMIGWQSGLETCSAGTPIGMIDTGIDVDHPAFAGGSIVTRSFAPVDAEEETHTHATGIAALIIGNGRESSPGLLPKARLIAADVFYVDGDKHVVTDTASLLRALDWLDQAGVGIINMSFSGPEDELVAKTIKRMSDKGVVFVAAAGNNGPGAAPAYPAAYPDVVAVTAVDSRMKGYIKANHGKYIDVAAPGVRIWTATASGKSGYQSGTSFAVPFVTAALAAGSFYGDPAAANNWLGSAALDDIGEPGNDAVFGRGLLRAPAGCGAQDSSGGLLSAFMTAPATADTTGSILPSNSR